MTEAELIEYMKANYTLELDDDGDVYRLRKGVYYPVGNYDSAGYVTAMIHGKTYKLHRLVWLYYKGSWPVGEIDHIDRDKTNNRIANLRDTTRSGNCINREFVEEAINVRFMTDANRARPWQVDIRRDNKRTSSYYTTEQEALNAVKAFKQTLETSNADASVHP